MTVGIRHKRYRQAFDKIIQEEKHRASVHFLVNMLEAYYFADAVAINKVLGTYLSDYSGDVETIRHPKNELKKLYLASMKLKTAEASLIASMLNTFCLAQIPVHRSEPYLPGVQKF